MIFAEGKIYTVFASTMKLCKIFRMLAFPPPPALQPYVLSYVNRRLLGTLCFSLVEEISVAFHTKYQNPLLCGEVAELGLVKFIKLGRFREEIPLLFLPIIPE